MKDEYYSHDITFCDNRRCTLKSCFRHLSHYRPYIKPFYSVAHLEGTVYCPKAKKEEAGKC